MGKGISTTRTVYEVARLFICGGNVFFNACFFNILSLEDTFVQLMMSINDYYGQLVIWIIIMSLYLFLLSLPVSGLSHPPTLEGGGTSCGSWAGTTTWHCTHHSSNTWRWTGLMTATQRGICYVRVMLIGYCNLWITIPNSERHFITMN